MDTPDIVTRFLDVTGRAVLVSDRQWGTRTVKYLRPRVTLADGVSLSIQASETHYCTPRDNIGPYTRVEVGSVAPSEGQVSCLATELREYAELDASGECFSGIYGYVPVALLNELIVKHGLFIDYTEDL